MYERPYKRSGGTAASPSANESHANGVHAHAPAHAAPTAREAAGPPEDSKPIRHHPVHLPHIERHNQPIILFVTVCTNKRKVVLANERVHAVLRSVWPSARQYLVGRYMLMPDHIHLFCSPTTRDPESIQKWSGYWKRLASMELPDLAPLWQRHCWDTQLRHVQHYDEKWAYVRENPIRIKLATNTNDWPYQGCLNELRW